MRLCLLHVRTVHARTEAAAGTACEGRRTALKDYISPSLSFFLPPSYFPSQHTPSLPLRIPQCEQRPDARNRSEPGRLLLVVSDENEKAPRYLLY